MANVLNPTGYSNYDRNGSSRPDPRYTEQDALKKGGEILSSIYNNSPTSNANIGNVALNALNKTAKAVTSSSKVTPRSDGGGGSVATASTPAYDPRQGLIDYYRQQNENARKSALDAIEARLKTQMGIYENQFGQMNDNYDSLINQAEVNYYKSRSALRESLANRGQLDSGLGRQEALNLGVARGNELGNINRQRQKAHDDYNNSIASLKAEAEADKATINNQYATELRNAIAQILAQQY